MSNDTKGRPSTHVENTTELASAIAAAETAAHDLATESVAVRLSDGAAFYDGATQVTAAAIKAKTDNLPADPAREGGNLATLVAKDFATQTTLAGVKTGTDKIPPAALVTSWHPGVTSAGGAASDPSAPVTLSSDVAGEKIGSVEAGQAAHVWCSVAGNPHDESCFAHWMCVPYTGTFAGAAPAAATCLKYEAIHHAQSHYVQPTPVKVDVYAIREAGKAGITVGLTIGQ